MESNTVDKIQEIMDKVNYAEDNNKVYAELWHDLCELKYEVAEILEGSQEVNNGK